MDSYEAMAFFFTEAEGGRKTPPDQLDYRTIARFSEDHDCWSCRVMHQDLPVLGMWQPVTIQFLVRGIPVPREFDLLEGKKVVARVKACQAMPK